MGTHFYRTDLCWKAVVETKCVPPESVPLLFDLHNAQERECPSLCGSWISNEMARGNGSRLYALLMQGLIVRCSPRMVKWQCDVSAGLTDKYMTLCRVPPRFSQIHRQIRWSEAPCRCSFLCLALSNYSSFTCGFFCSLCFKSGSQGGSANIVCVCVCVCA